MPIPRPAAAAPEPFARAVRRLVARIPRGRVMTYGDVAAALGRPRAARAVGAALAALDARLGGVVPWHRVVNAAGGVSPRGDGWDDEQRARLLAEGTPRTRAGRVDLRRARWTPRAPARPRR